MSGGLLSVKGSVIKPVVLIGRLKQDDGGCCDALSLWCFNQSMLPAFLSLTVSIYENPYNTSPYVTRCQSVLILEGSGIKRSISDAFVYLKRSGNLSNAFCLQQKTDLNVCKTHLTLKLITFCTASECCTKHIIVFAITVTPSIKFNLVPCH